MTDDPIGRLAEADPARGLDPPPPEDFLVQTLALPRREAGRAMKGGRVRKRAVPGALAATGAIAAAAAVGVAAATGPEPLRVSALTEGPRAQLSPVATRMAASLDGVEAAPDKARTLGIPPGQKGTWALMPTDDGACLVAPGDSMFCAPAKNVNDGTLLGVRAPNAMPQKLSPSQLEDLQAGRLIDAPMSMAGSTVTGVAPDRVVAVALLDGSGQAIATSSVVDNLYGVSDIDMSAVASLRLIHADGTSTDTRMR